MTEQLSDTAAAAARWARCARCHAITWGRRLARAYLVCPACGHHGRLTAEQRVDLLLDPGSAKALPVPTPMRTSDPLRFTDVVPYRDRLRAAQAETGLDEAVVCLRGTIEGAPVVMAVMDFRFLGGSLGGMVGELITMAAETALRERLPLVIVSASGGARMQEGAIALMQMAKTAGALRELDAAGVLTISVVTDPTYGGVAASHAMLCDIVISEPGARMGFAGPRVIEQTIRERLPAGFQTAEFLMSHGMIDMICRRAELRGTLSRLLSAQRPERDRPGPERPGPDEPADPRIQDPDLLTEPDAWLTVRRARDLSRPTTTDYLGTMLDSFVELHGDRISADCPAIVGGMGLLDGRPLIVVGQQKGHTAAELRAHNYGMPTPAGYRKAARLFRLAGKLGLPVLALIDTPGAYPGKEAEEQGQAAAIAENLRIMAGLPVPIVSVITGEGGSGGALALAVADQVLICANAIYSVISPEGCAAILWKDSSAAAVAAQALHLDARALLRLRVVDGVIPEPGDGFRDSADVAARLVRGAVVAAFRELSGRTGAQLVERRGRRFRSYQAYSSDGGE